MPAPIPTLADGQVAITTPAALVEGVAGPLNITFTNTNAVTQTLVLTVQRNGGTARRIARAVLAENQQFIIAGLPLNAADTLLAVTTTAEAVDYFVSAAPDSAPLAIYSLDANGALRSGSAAIVGPFTITDDLTVTGDVEAENGIFSGDLTAGGGDIDAGASGTAGSVDIFPGTAASGKLAITVTDQTGDTTVALNVAAMAAARSLSIPDPLASADVLLGKQAAVARTATADGLTTGTIADGGCRQHITVTSANANNIIVLPTPTPGTEIVLDVGATGFELRSSDPATIAINGGTGATAESAIPANSTVFMRCVSATAWKGFFLDADSDLAKVEAAA